MNNQNFLAINFADLASPPPPPPDQKLLNDKIKAKRRVLS